MNEPVIDLDPAADWLPPPRPMNPRDWHARDRRWFFRPDHAAKMDCRIGDVVVARIDHGGVLVDEVLEINAVVARPNGIRFAGLTGRGRLLEFSPRCIQWFGPKPRKPETTQRLRQLYDRERERGSKPRRGRIPTLAPGRPTPATGGPEALQAAPLQAAQ